MALLPTGSDKILEINIEAAGVCEEFDDCADAAVYNLNIAPVFFEQTD